MRSIKKSSRTCVVRDELAERMGSLFCGKATAVAACHWHAAKSRLSNPTRARVIMPEKSPSGWMGFFLAERVGFEPTVPLPVHLISSQGRYNHFDTTPYELALVLYQQARAKSRGFLRKLRECFLRRGNASCFCCKRGVHRRRTFCGNMSEISVANSHFRCYSRQASRAYAARILKLGA